MLFKQMGMGEWGGGCKYIIQKSFYFSSELTSVSVFLKMSPNLSWNSQGSLALRLRAAYDAAMVVAGIVSPRINLQLFTNLGTESQISR